MTVHYSDDAVTLHHGDCLDVLRAMPDCSVDAVVTDPPYGLEFMGRDWDKFGAVVESSADTRNRDGNWTTPPFGGGGQRVRFGASPGLPFQQWCQEWAAECLRVLKPGGHLLAFGGTRTYHRLTCGIEDAGFEIRDSIVWVYASGFPKSLDVSKAIDKAAGAEREVLGTAPYFARDGATRRTDGSHAVPHEQQGGHGFADRWSAPITAASTDAARRWQGWGTALKPAQEPIVVARKPLAGTVAGNVLAWGTGALNIDGCRVQPTDRAAYEAKCASVVGLDSNRNGSAYGEWTGERQDSASSGGRWPSNLVLSHASTPDGADLCGAGCVEGCPVRELDQQSGFTVSPSSTGRGAGGQHGAYSPIAAQGKVSAPGDSGGASRFFPTFRYEPKAPTAERPRIGGGKAPGIAANRCKTCGRQEPGMTGSPCTCPAPEWEKRTGPTDVIAHPTVKPLDLMRWLVRLVTPPGGLVLEPFAGSGTTAEACVLEGMCCVAIEREATYLPLIVQRLSKPLQPGLFG